MIRPSSAGVAIALRRLYDLPFEHRPWSVFGDGDKIRPSTRWMRVPTMVLDDGDVIVDSPSIDRLHRQSRSHPVFGLGRKRSRNATADYCHVACHGAMPTRGSLCFTSRSSMTNCPNSGWSAANGRCWACSTSVPAKRRRRYKQILVWRAVRPCGYRSRLRDPRASAGSSICGSSGLKNHPALSALNARCGMLALPRDFATLHRIIELGHSRRRS